MDITKQMKVCHVPQNHMFVHMLMIFSTIVIAINFNTNVELGYCVKQEGDLDFVLLFFAVLLLTCFDLLLRLAFLSVIPMKISSKF